MPTSEIRLRDVEARSDDDSRDTIPTPPPSFDETKGAWALWADLDGRLMVAVFQLEERVPSWPDERWAVHAATLVDEIASLADALFVLCGPGAVPQGPWRGPAARAYAWALEIMREISDATTDRDDEVARVFHRLSEHAKLFIEAILRPALLGAIEHERAPSDHRQRQRLRTVEQRVLLVASTLARAAGATDLGGR
jgi:hypothetical protein